MLESLPPSIRTELEIIRRQNSDREALKFLPSIFDLLLKNEETKEFLCDLEKKTLEKQKQEGNDKQKAVEWIREKSNEIKTHPLANHFLVKPALEQLDRTLNLEDIRLDQSYISSSLNDLKEAACLLANFGKHEIFENWAPIEIKTNQINLYDLLLPISNKMTKLSLNSQLGKQLIKRLNRGFIRATIIPISKQLGIEKNRIEIEYGSVDLFKIPEFVKRFYECYSSRRVTVCTATLKSDPLLLYQHLKLLSQNWKVEPIDLLMKKIPTHWQELDILSTQARNWFYLSTLQSEKKEPLDHKKIVDLVETFLLMVTRFCIGQSESNTGKKESEKTIKKRKANLDEIKVKNFIIEQRRITPKTSRSSMLAKIQVAITTKKLQLTQVYALSTYKKWDRQVDPIKDMKEKLSRPKSENLS